MHLSLLTVDLLETLHFLLLLLSVVLQDADLFPHLLLDEHVILHAALEELDGLPAIFADPPRVPFLVEVGVSDLLDVQ